MCPRLIQMLVTLALFIRFVPNFLTFRKFIFLVAGKDSMILSSSIISFLIVFNIDHEFLHL